MRCQKSFITVQIVCPREEKTTLNVDNPVTDGAFVSGA